MSIDKRKLHSFLYSNGYKYLYHSNVIAISQLFISQGGLLSKQELKNRGLEYLLKYSNKLGRSFDTSNDIPVNPLNLGKFYSKFNIHGPVCFVLSIDVLLDDTLPNVYINSNGVVNEMDTLYCNNMNKYLNIFSSNSNKEFSKLNMIYFKNYNNVIPFNPYLKKIILETPVTYDKDIDTIVKDGIKSFEDYVHSKNIKVPIEHYSYIINPKECNAKLFYILNKTNP